MKKRKNKRIKTEYEKEQAFIKFGSNFLMVAIFVVAVIFAFNGSFGQIDLSDTDSLSLSSLSLLSEKVDTNELITNQLSDVDKPLLIEKIKNAKLDILTDDEFDYNKYIADTISMKNNISLTANDIGLIYSYLFVNNEDKFGTILYEVTFSTTADETTIKIVSSINFYKAFTSKLSDDYDNSTRSELPKRVYLTNTITYVDGIYSYSQVLYNNVNESGSKEISKLVDSVNSYAKLNQYVPQLLLAMIENISIKTNSTFVFHDNQITFQKDASI